MHDWQIKTVHTYTHTGDYKSCNLYDSIQVCLRLFLSFLLLFFLFLLQPYLNWMFKALIILLRRKYKTFCNINVYKERVTTHWVYPEMFCNVLLIHVTNYFILVTFTYINKHVCIWIFSEFKWRIVEPRICRWQLLHVAKNRRHQLENQEKIILLESYMIRQKIITSSSPPYCSSNALFTSSFVTRSSSNLSLKTY